MNVQAELKVWVRALSLATPFLELEIGLSSELSLLLRRGIRGG